MAREESDREDLLREATALVERIELAPSGHRSEDHIVAGFRAAGGLSIYFGSDPSYQFNSAGELRRAFVGGFLVKAESGRLVALERMRHAHEVDLVRKPLPTSEQVEFLAQMQQKLHCLAADCEANRLRIVGQVPQDVDVLGRVLAELKRLAAVQVAQSPRVS